MISFILFILFRLCQNYEIFITPISSTPCLQQVLNPCNGSIQRPFDDLQYAFASLASIPYILSQDIKFNLISPGTSYNFFVLRSSTTGYGATISPFENFTGFISFLKILLICY